MDILEDLEKDHKEIEKLFKKINKEKTPNKCGELFRELSNKITSHSKAEENAFYNKIRNDSTESLIKNSLEEHNKMQIMLNDISNLSSFSNSWREKINELHEIVSSHIKDEEEITFKEAKAQANSNELKEMDYAFMEIKEEMMEA